MAGTELIPRPDRNADPTNPDPTKPPSRPSPVFIWAFGRQYELHLHHPGPGDHQLPENHVGARAQKNKIVLHTTGFNRPAERIASTWESSGDTSANYIVERSEHNPNSSDHNYIYVVQAVDPNYAAHHAGPVNPTSIGIEHVNLGSLGPTGKPGERQVLAECNDDVVWLDDNGHEVPLGQQTVANGYFRRTADPNRYLRAIYPRGGSRHRNWQALQEAQYRAMILLLRHLCITFRIPRRFLGDTFGEGMQNWYDAGAVARNRLHRFRGILSHGNVTDGHAACGLFNFHCNRLFRGIIDEWWLPVDFDGQDRGYYTGPFDPQPHQRGDSEQPSLFRWVGEQVEQKVFRDATPEVLHETRSYFDLERAEEYFSTTERQAGEGGLGGTFPIGTNKVWHGGIHLTSTRPRKPVCAAASGMIVAARLEGNPAVENAPQRGPSGEEVPAYGSQRFVLIRHCVYMLRQPEPGRSPQFPELGQDTRIRYDVDPFYVFTLYMHLAPFPQPLHSPHPENPPWFNWWLRHRTTDDDPKAVFCPNVEVSVGDWIGNCGKYLGKDMIHFEVVSKEEFAMWPWDDPSYAARDPGPDEICNSAVIDRYVRDRTGGGIDTADILDVARKLRKVKSYHKSEWALANADALIPVIQDGLTREERWSKLQHFMWVADAVRKCSELAAQLCDATGMMWHYHPLTFMHFVNSIILEEDREVDESSYDRQARQPGTHDFTTLRTNVLMEGGYLTRFVDFTTGTAVPQPADSDPVRPFDFYRDNPPHEPPDSNRYRFTRREIGCHTGTHDVGAGTQGPTETLFHLTLLDLLQDIRIILGGNLNNPAVRIGLSHVCAADSSQATCVVGNVASHAAGHAVDISPVQKIPEKCEELWRAVHRAIDHLNQGCTDYLLEPSESNPAERTDISAHTFPDIERILKGEAEDRRHLNQHEAQRLAIHIELARNQQTPYD